MVDVYRIVNKVNGKSYIGITSLSTEQRWKKHVHDLRNSSRRRTKLLRALAKYGTDNFSIETLTVTPDWGSACELESKYIVLYDSKVNGYNMTDGGDGHTGLKHTEETRAKMRASHLGKRQSESSKRKCSETKMGQLNPNYGKVYTLEERQAQSARMTGSNNPRALSYRVTHPSGAIEIVHDRQAFCSEYELNYNSVASATTRGNLHRGFRFERLT